MVASARVSHPAGANVLALGVSRTITRSTSSVSYTLVGMPWNARTGRMFTAGAKTRPQVVDPSPDQFVPGHIGPSDGAGKCGVRRLDEVGHVGRHRRALPEELLAAPVEVGHVEPMTVTFPRGPQRGHGRRDDLGTDSVARKDGETIRLGVSRHARHPFAATGLTSKLTCQVP